MERPFGGFAAGGPAEPGVNRRTVAIPAMIATSSSTPAPATIA
ncbi:MAG TPA: hypothetical protein VIX59_06495 [Candidatus Binataceae bacterium]